ncbi:MAG: biopolymer transporter ExbD [Oxalobacteraceae bacterium]|mgnify:CR=1 FL=1|nr:MAG: biopolymer transporter ExbD [Oxalobacteraceae bacterium]
MAFGGFDNNRQGAPMADINVTPMVDVMLVLLVIFIITAPLFTHAVKLDLPAAQSAPAPEKPETVTLSIDPAGAIFWNDAPVSQADLPARMAAAAQRQPQPELQLRADKATRYEVIAQVMAAAQSNGLTKLGFVTEPTATPATPAAR